MYMHIFTEQQLFILLAKKKKKNLIFSQNLPVLAMSTVFGQSIVLIF